jgi:hypothetical protein
MKSADRRDCTFTTLPRHEHDGFPRAGAQNISLPCVRLDAGTHGKLNGIIRLFYFNARD